mmetsp:Transcript_8896/g.29438  ORF Transcript_8896/g.29438 Transcript_8896/m.29438 type:complete len:229 (-) Transcript_8896:888-1574(-)
MNRRAPRRSQRCRSPLCHTNPAYIPAHRLRPGSAGLALRRCEPRPSHSAASYVLLLPLVLLVPVAAAQQSRLLLDRAARCPGRAVRDPPEHAGRDEEERQQKGEQHAAHEQKVEVLLDDERGVPLGERVERLHQSPVVGDEVGVVQHVGAVRAKGHQQGQHSKQPDGHEQLVHAQQQRPPGARGAQAHPADQQQPAPDRKQRDGRGERGQARFHAPVRLSALLRPGHP